MSMLIAIYAIRLIHVLDWWGCQLLKKWPNLIFLIDSLDWWECQWSKTAQLLLLFDWDLTINGPNCPINFLTGEVRMPMDRNCPICPIYWWAHGDFLIFFCHGYISGQKTGFLRFSWLGRDMPMNSASKFTNVNVDQRCMSWCISVFRNQWSWR